MKLERPKNFFGEDIQLTVFVPSEYLDKKIERKLYGKYFKDTGIFNIFPENYQGKGDYLGKIGFDDFNDYEDILYGKISDSDINFYYNGEEVKAEIYNLYQNIFSRNTGILETNVMKDKCAIIIGCGSVGSLIAVELAKAGVGHFILCDQDTLEYHNLCRHQCGIEDVGDLKVNSVKRKINNINPDAEIICFNGVIENIPKQILDSMCKEYDSIFIGCADTRTADVYANKLAIYYNMSFLSVGFWERAYVGEIFYYLYNKNMSSYDYAIGGGSLSDRKEANHHVYSNEENINEINFEPGISVDINFVTCIAIKLIIDILNINNLDYIPRLLNELNQYTLVANTNNVKIAGETVEIFSYPLQVTRSLVLRSKENI